MNLEMNTYILISLIIIGIIILISSIIIINILNKIKNRKNIIQNIDNEKTLDELNKLIDYKCKNYTEKIFIPLQNKSIKNIEWTIREEQVKEATINISTEILSSLSNEFRLKLTYLIKEERIDTFITELVYELMYSIVIKINSKTLTKFK